VGGALHLYLSQNKEYIVSGTFAHTFKEGLKKLDVTSYDELANFFGDNEFDFLIWCSGNKDLKFCEKNPDFAFALNAGALRDTVDVYDKLSLRGKLIYISTDYVFDGERGGYACDDTTGPRTVYGRTKLDAENILLGSSIDARIARSSAIMGRGGTFFDWLVSALRTDSALDMFDNTFFSPTPLKFFCLGISELIANYDAWSPVIHLNARERLTRYQFALDVARLTDSKSQITRAFADFSSMPFQKDLSLKPSAQVSALQRRPLAECLRMELDSGD
jgi:dTDP-4-dehydrorhamnose reductase